MNGLNDILKTANFADRINKQFDAFNSVSNILTSYNWSKQSSTLNMTQALLKGATQNSNWINSVQAISNMAVAKNKIQIPNTAFEAIKSITNQNQQIFEQLNNSIALSSQLWNSAHVSNLSKAMNSISAQMAELASYHKKWNLIDDFDEITEEVVLINDRIIEEEGLSNENLQNLNEFLNRIEIKIDNQDKGTSAIFWKLMTLVGLILAIMAEVRNWTPKAEFATKEDIENTITKHFSNFENKLKEHKEYRITNRKCKVFLKPKPKSNVIANFEEGFEFVVLNVKHKWIYVSYLNPKDNLPETGWIMKKYTEKIK